MICDHKQTQSLGAFGAACCTASQRLRRRELVVQLPRRGHRFEAYMHLGGDPRTPFTIEHVGDTRTLRGFFAGVHCCWLHVHNFHAYASSCCKCFAVACLHGWGCIDCTAGASECIDVRCSACAALMMRRQLPEQQHAAAEGRPSRELALLHVRTCFLFHT